MHAKLVVGAVLQLTASGALGSSAIENPVLAQDLQPPRVTTCLEQAIQEQAPYEPSAVIRFVGPRFLERRDAVEFLVYERADDGRMHATHTLTFVTADGRRWRAFSDQNDHIGVFAASMPSEATVQSVDDPAVGFSLSLEPCRDYLTARRQD
jgi:hypothetical protein